MPKASEKDDKKESTKDEASVSKQIIVNKKSMAGDPMKRSGSESDLVPGPPAVSESNSKFKNLKRENKIKISPEGNLEQDDQPEPAKDSEPKLTKEEKPEDNKSGSKTPALASIMEIIEPGDKEKLEAKSKAEDPEPKDDDSEKSSEQLKDTKEKKIRPDENVPKAEDKKENSDEKSEDDEKSDDSSEKSSDEENASKATVQPTDGLVDELAKKAADIKSKAKEDKEASVKQEQVDKLVESKKYALPIGEVTRRRNTRIMLVLLLVVIILAAVVANFAIDAGIIQTDIKPLTDVIPN